MFVFFKSAVIPTKYQLSRHFTNHHQAGLRIILQAEPQNGRVSYTSEHQGDKMITVLVVFMTFIFIVGSISPLLVTEDMQDIVQQGRS